jgi:hypothetical protein
MKKIIFTNLMFILMTCLHSQDVKIEENYREKFQTEWTAGDHLIHSKRLKIQSLIIAPSAAILGSVVMFYSSNESIGRAVMGGAIIGVGAVVSFTLSLDAARHIGIAGIKLNKNQK